MSISSINSAQAQQATPLIPNGGAGVAVPGGSNSNGLSFGDVMDAINPLQHIPILSGLMRAATGSQISSAAQVAGDTLFGAILPGGAIAGLISSAADVAVKNVSGKDISEHVVDTLKGSSPASTATALSGTPLVASTDKTPDNASAALAAAIKPQSFAESYKAHATHHEYQRVQALDAINEKLVKITI